MLPEMDRERLLHILDSGRQISEFINAISEEEFLKNVLIQHGVTHCLYIIGEAASRVSEMTQNNYPEIEWDVIRGMRNRLAHAYFDINLHIIWITATIDTPELMERVLKLLSSN